jgi:hypothetical protein
MIFLNAQLSRRGELVIDFYPAILTGVSSRYPVDNTGA